MKACQIAFASHSVYALDVHQRVRAIQRRPDGLWGPWQEAGPESREIVHAGDMIARIGLDHCVSAARRCPSPEWASLDLDARRLAAARLPDGAPALFASDGDHLVWHT